MYTSPQGSRLCLHDLFLFPPRVAFPRVHAEREQLACLASAADPRERAGDKSHWPGGSQGSSSAGQEGAQLGARVCVKQMGARPRQMHL